jgi:hypothetical protein
MEQLKYIKEIFLMMIYGKALQRTFFYGFIYMEALQRNFFDGD